MVVAGRRENYFQEVMQEATVFFLSLRKHNETWQPRFIIFTTKDRLVEVCKLQNIFPVEIQVIDTDHYEEAGKGDERYFKLEAYKVEDEKVIVFDSDILWLGNPYPLIQIPVPTIGMAREKRRDVYNSGLVIINRLAVGDIWEQIMKHPHDGGFGNDQNILNSFFKGRISEIPGIYNTLITEAGDTTGVVGLHMILKPWWDYLRGRIDETVTNQLEIIFDGYLGKKVASR